MILVAGLVAVSSSLHRERQARLETDAALRQAKADEASAQTEAAKSEQVKQFLEDMLRGVGPSVALGRDTTLLREILNLTSERVGKELTNQPAVEAELRGLIGRVYLEIGSYAQAEEMERAALDINRRQFGPNSKEVGDALNDLGAALWRQGKLVEPEACYQKALAIRQQLLGDDNPNVADSLANLSDVYRHQGRAAEAEALSREALRIRQKFFGKVSLPVADSLRSLSIISGDKGNWAEAESLAREVLAMRRQILGPEHPLVASALVDVAWAVGSSGKADESESLNLEALTMRRKLLGEDHPEVAKSLYLVGGGLWKQGKPVEAYSILTAALSIQRKLLGESNPATIDTLHCMGLVRASEGKFAEAENLHREALALWRARGDAESSQGLYELRSLIQVLMAQNKFNDAKTLLDQVLTSTFINKPESVDLLALRADLEGRLSQWRQSAADTALILEKKPTKSEFYAMQAALLIKANDRPAYETFRKRLLTSYAGTTNIFVGDQVAKACLFLPPSAADLPVISHLTEMAVTLGAGDDGAMPFFALGRALSEYREGHFAEAIEWAEKTLKSSRVEADGHAYAVLALANWQLGKKEEARIMLMNGNTLMPTIMPKRFSEDPGNAWLGWLFARVTLDEATALIQPASPADDNSKSP
jgi:tetratricopeptide (TPR) repeat protein